MKMQPEIEAGDRGVAGDEMFHKAITTAAHWPAAERRRGVLMLMAIPAS